MSPTQISARGAAWARAGAMMILVIALYLLLDRFGVFSVESSVEGAVGVGTIFVVGVIAATSSCLAVVGGLLLSVSAKWADSHAAQSRWQRFQPLFFFNMGRLGGYFVLGGLAGLLGQSLALSPYGTGVVTVAVSVVMIILALNILHIVPKEYCRIPLPARLRKKVQELSQSRRATGAILLGAFTFFLPCGFTQSMQLLALGSGGFLAGGIIMLVFALGTLPALLGISIVSSVVQGPPARWFFIFSGAVVLLLGVLSMQRGLLLMGYDVIRYVPGVTPTAIADAKDDPFVTVDEQGRQIMSMYVTSNGYSPSSFTIRPGMQTWVYAIAKNGVTGCATFLIDAAHNLETPIHQGGNWLGPIENPTKDFVLTCSIGRLRANVHVQKS
jgi:sulfite exporter TauE/SafE